MLATGILMVSPLFLPKLQPRKNKAFNIFQGVLIVLTYIAGFMFVSEKVPYVLEYLLVLGSCYLVIGFTIGLVNRNKIIEEAMTAKSIQALEERR